MRLKRLTITNFGIYKNENTFNFPYSVDQNVSIIIGKNGSGKTTFLNAIKICLFGSMILKNRTITKSYEELILDKLNKTALKEALPRFSINATFISQVHNFDGEFSIERSWDVNTSFKEEVHMSKNGVPLSLEEQETFFNALYHAFPLDLFELFYLDGEKIDQLSVLNSNIIELLESSINIDLFKKLRRDLLSYASKRVNSKEVERLNKEKDAGELKLETIITSLEKVSTDTEIIRKSMDKKADELKNFKDSLHIQTIAIDAVELNNIEKEISELKRVIERELTIFLPYTLITEQLNNLLNQITSENETGKNKIIAESLTTPELNGHLIEEFEQQEIDRMIASITRFYPSEDLDFVHNLSNDEYYSLKSKLGNLLDYNKEELHKKMKQLETLEHQSRTLSKEAEEINAAEAAGQLDELLTLKSELDELMNSLSSHQETTIKLQSEKETVEINLSDLENELWKQLKKSNITNVLDQINTVLDQYIIQIKEKKISEIEHHTKFMFDRLIRKEGFIKDFKLKDHSIYLMDHSGNKLNHSNLSAGEKQLFVLSLIYAILKSSERTVPLMFDTLLGRLDEEHRDNVFKEFISSCPDQVIILATDSELANIDKKYLSSITNTEYTIDFSKKENQMLETRM